jgi:hypothetical protein
LLIPIIAATQEVEISRIMVESHPGQNNSKTPISTNKLGVVVSICGPSYVGGMGRRIMV